MAGPFICFLSLKVKQLVCATIINNKPNHKMVNRSFRIIDNLTREFINFLKKIYMAATHVYSKDLKAVKRDQNSGIKKKYFKFLLLTSGKPYTCESTGRCLVTLRQAACHERSGETLSMNWSWMRPPQPTQVAHQSPKATVCL